MSIRFESVTKSFGSKIVLQNISFQVSKGEILFILGKSGMGKSVVLKQIVGLMKPDSGSVFVDEEDVTSLSSEPLTMIRRKCGMVFQHPALMDSLTVLENVGFGLRTLFSEKKTQDIVVENLALVNLGPEILNRFPREISYGMQKRVSLARTLAPKPSYLLFDEPTTGLDPITTNAVTDLIFTLSRKLQVTSIVVSHDMGCALKIADQILILDQARILAHGSVREIKESKESLILEFLEETRALLPYEERKENRTL